MGSPAVSALHAPSRAASVTALPRLPGLIGWVPNCDTLHALIREYRDARKIPLNVEHRLMLGMAPDYDHLTVIQKVEVFEHALESTSGALDFPS
jgi:FKBP12-rapamycin complex-associated protein